MTPKNGCSACREDFASVSVFDRHRVGTHAYTLGEGLRQDPPREDGRRCLDPDEMRAKGWGRDAKGRWQDPIGVARARIGFSRGDTGAETPLRASPDAPGAPAGASVGDSRPETADADSKAHSAPSA